MLAELSTLASCHGRPAHDGPQAVPGCPQGAHHGIGRRPIIGGTPMSRRAFTLIEMLVVIAIIAILMGAMLAIGSSLRASATRRATLAQLQVLDKAMQQFLLAGNPEPPVPSPWPYDMTQASLQYAPTIPASDPCNWVTALRSDPKTRAAVDSQNLQTDTDSSIPKVGAGATRTLILDNYGNPIRYIPSNPATGKAGYFMSAGPDGKFSNMTPAPATPYRGDEIYSTDPQ